MAQIVFRGLYAAFPMVGLTAGDLAYATDLLVLFEWSGTAWIAYHDYPDFQGDKSGLYLQPEWGAIIGDDVNFVMPATNLPTGSTPTFIYAVPVGRTLYLSGFSFTLWATLAEDRDNLQVGWAALYNLTTGIYLARIGGNGGGGIPFPKPMVIPGGDTLYLILGIWANHNCDGRVHTWGYQI